MKSETLEPPDIKTSQSELARSVLTDSLMSVRKWLKRAALEGTDDDESVHQLRVAGRRAVSALYLFETLVPATEVRWFRKRLKSIHRAAGRARDLDVLIGTLSPQCGLARKSVVKHWQAERSAAQEPLVTLYRKLNQNDRFRKHVRSLVGNMNMLGCDAEHTAQPDFDAPIAAQFAILRRRVVTALGIRADVKSLHVLRIAVKKLRYAAIVLLPALRGAQVSDMLVSLEGLQKQLGALQDHVVAKQELKRSIERLKKRSHEKILRELIESEARSIKDSVKILREWLKSDACRELKQCIESLA